MGRAPSRDRGRAPRVPRDTRRDAGTPLSLPFTQPDFFAVFARYHEWLGPLQILLLATGVATLVLSLLRGRSIGRIVSAILAVLWAWMGVVYHLVFFLPVNPAAALFAAIFLAGAALFIWDGVLHARLQFRLSLDAHGAAGIALLVYALVLYPELSYLLGRIPAETPSFGLPCPTTIFTIGLIGFVERPFPRRVLIAPLLWTVAGAQAAWLFGVYEDLGLVLAGVVALWFALGSAPERKTA